jgi:UDP-glucose 4-epimerase
LGWAPQVTFEQGVAKMLAVIDYWREAPVWDRASIAEATKTWFAFLEKGTATPVA